jgi:hypothetical protein
MFCGNPLPCADHPKTADLPFSQEHTEFEDNEYGPIASWEILNELRHTFDQIKVQEGLIRRDAESHNIPPMRMRLVDGSYAMVPILTAKAHLLPALYAAEKELRDQEEARKITEWLRDMRAGEAQTEGSTDSDV